MKRFTLTMLIAAQCIGGQFAHADSTSSPPRQVEVHFADLNLAHVEGAAALYTRLRAAAVDVCTVPDERPLERGRRFTACVADALSAVVGDVGQPLLSSYHQSKLDGHVTAYAAGASR